MATPKKGLGKSFQKIFGEDKLKKSFVEEENEEKITLDSSKNNISVSNDALFIEPGKASAEEIEEVDDEVTNENLNRNDEIEVSTEEESSNQKLTPFSVMESTHTENETSPSENVSADENKESAGKPLLIDINHIHPNKEQPRKVFDEEKLNELANSIQNYGIISPLVVREDGPMFYSIIAGERRYRAAKMLNLQKIPVIIKNLNDKTTKEVALIENIQREDLNPVEKAQGYQELIREYNMSQDELAKILGKSKASISNSLRILSLGPEIIKLMNEGQITEGHARALLGIDDEDFRRKVAKKVADEKISVRKIEDMVRLEKLATNRKDNERRLNNNENYKKLKEHIKEIREQMQKKLNNAKIDIIAKDENVGYINITYNNQEELDNIYLLIKSIGENV